MSWTKEQVQNAVKMVGEKAAGDESFRQLCLSDIHEAVKVATGLTVPEHFKINVIDGSGYHANILLPELKTEQDELSETELTGVAGGSKSGATDFFNGVVDVAKDVGNAVVDTAERLVPDTINININPK